MDLFALSLTKMDCVVSEAGRAIGGYRKETARKTAFGLLLLVLLCGVFLLSLGVGSLRLSVPEIADALLNQSAAAGQHGFVMRGIRLPRSVGAVLAGASLGVAGAVMQNILRNPLASPFTIGVSQGAGFGAAFAIIALGAGQFHRTGSEAVTIGAPYVVIFSAFCGSLLTVAFILALSSLRRISPEAVILAGVAISAFFGAATMLLQYFASDVQVAATVFWTFGDIGKAGWQENMLMAVAFVIPFVWFFSMRWSLNAAQWGDDVARSLGVPMRMLRLTAMTLACLSVSVVTAFLGIIGFVGLIAPHIMRLFVGNDHRFLVPASALFGGLFLLCADVVGRILMPPVIIPVGIITSFAGAPLFLYFLIRGRTR